MRSGLRPAHSVDTMTCTSEMSGTASTGVAVIAQMPHTVRITVPVNTRNRLRAQASTMRSIMRSSADPIRSALLCYQTELPAPEALTAADYLHRHVPSTAHHD